MNMDWNGEVKNLGCHHGYGTHAAVTLYAKWNAPPVANNASVTVSKDIAAAITLAASDANANPLNYSVVSGPTNGVLTGTAPNLIYTPNFHFSGNDSFTFKVNDATTDSNPATVSITVQGVRVFDYAANVPFPPSIPVAGGQENPTFFRVGLSME